jgi:DNA polymerase-3 subunit delta'
MQNYLTNPSHLLILVGKNGVGKSALAKNLISKNLSIPIEKLASHQFYHEVNPDNGLISIDSVRKLQCFLKLKSTGKNTIRRGILIEHGERLSIEAQNALLKILEEPPSDTCIVLTLQSKGEVLPTIFSRAQTINVIAPDKEAVIKHFKSAYNNDKIKSAYHLSDGLPGLMSSILVDDKLHPLVLAVDEVKVLLKKSRFDRLMMINDYSKNRSRILVLIKALERIAESSLLISRDKKSFLDMEVWTKVLKKCVIAEEAYYANANAKLILTTLFINL